MSSANCSVYRDLYVNANCAAYRALLYANANCAACRAPYVTSLLSALKKPLHLNLLISGVWDSSHCSHAESRCPKASHSGKVFHFYFLFRQGFMCSPGSPWTPCSWGWPWMSAPPKYTSQVLELTCARCMCVCCAWGQAQVSAQAKQALYQRRYLPRPLLLTPPIIPFTSQSLLSKHVGLEHWLILSPV